MRQVDNTVWTEWTTVFQVERIGDRYLQLAMQENSIDGVLSSSSSAGDLADSSLTTTLVAVEIMRESLQLLLDIAILAGPMNQVIQERLRINSLSGSEESVVASTMSADASRSPFKALSSPVGGELEAFPPGIPNGFSGDNKDNKSNETTANDPSSVTTSRRQPSNTFDVASLGIPRIVGISLFMLTIVGYGIMLHLPRKHRKHLEENGAISATENNSSIPVSRV